MSRVAIVGAGWYGFKPQTIDISFQDMMFESSSRAYSNLDPRKDIDAFVDCQEDMWEGIAIADEFAPEPIGGALRPTYTVSGDGLQGIAHAFMLIKTGHFNVVAVESHGKPSEIKTLQDIYRFALDPLYVRPLDTKNPLFYAGLDAIAYMNRNNVKREHLAMVAVKNKTNGLRNERASFSTRIDLDNVLSYPYSIYPMSEYEIAPFSDASITFVLASEEVARKYTDFPVWLNGIGYSTETGTGVTEWHEWGRMKSMKNSALMAYKLAGIDGNPDKYFDFAEVEDRFSFMELLSLEELMIAKEGEAHKMLEKGDFNFNGYKPVNPSGGSLSMGVQLEATGLARLLEAYLQLKNQAGLHQLKGVSKALVASWRGVPTYTSAVALLSI
ncbi:MAG: thiolase domain-containing protein [Caldisphaera sp.]|nr:MAG: acetyl-CoA acetyltransferase [Caldisphaera sp.]PMP88826.1 MAG: acetyl-CoA acetyltransferase [Caldisphaera sp.]